MLLGSISPHKLHQKAFFLSKKNFNILETFPKSQENNGPKFWCNSRRLALRESITFGPFLESTFFGRFFHKIKKNPNSVEKPYKNVKIFLDNCFLIIIFLYFAIWPECDFYYSYEDESCTKILLRISAFNRRKNFWKRVSILCAPSGFKICKKSHFLQKICPKNKN